MADNNKQNNDSREKRQESGKTGRPEEPAAPSRQTAGAGEPAAPAPRTTTPETPGKKDTAAASPRPAAPESDAAKGPAAPAPPAVTPKAPATPPEKSSPDKATAPERPAATPPAAPPKAATGPAQPPLPRTSSAAEETAAAPKAPRSAQPAAPDKPAAPAAPRVPPRTAAAAEPAAPEKLAVPEKPAAPDEPAAPRKAAAETADEAQSVTALPAADRLKVCIATAEVTPLAKTGGLADVSAALATFLHRAGHDVRLLMPRYARIDTLGLAIEPVPGLQRIPMSLGHRVGHFSIDSTTLPGTDLTIYLLRCPELYDRPGIYTDGEDEHLRFILLSRAAIIMCQYLRFAPDIFSCHDWHTSLIPLYLRSIYAWDRLFENTRSVLTIHNIGYQGVFGAGILGDLDLDDTVYQLHQEDLGRGRINFLKNGLLHADLITTVSPTYAREIQGDEYGMGLQDMLRWRSSILVGILNGVDYGEWDPAIDPLIPANYTPENLDGKATCKLELLRNLGLPQHAERPLFGIVTRLVGQKGIDLLEGTLPAMFGRRQFAMAILGSGEDRYERFFTKLQQHYPDRVCFYRGYNNKLAHRIEAGADMFLMPSLYEPCGLNQMYSLKYGTVPIVRETGGLADSVELVDPRARTGTGILFRDYDATGLAWAMATGLELYKNKPLWRQIMLNGMAKDFSWETQTERYVELFRALR